MIEVGTINPLGPKGSLLNYIKAAVNSSTFSHWWTNMYYFFNRENFEQAALDINIWVGLLHNITIHKCYFLGPAALSSRIQR